MLKDRRDGQSEVLKYKLANLVPEQEMAKRDVSAKLKDAREEWLSSEKLRLQKLADAKTSELKREAVKALEPELHRLISGNKEDLKQREADANDQFERFKEEKKKELDLALREEEERIEKECDKEIEQLRKKQSATLMEMAGNEDDDLKEVRDSWKKEMERERAAFETERRRLVAGYNGELEKLREVENSHLERFHKEHGNDMLRLKEQREEMVTEKKAEWAEELAQWQRRKLVEIREDLEMKHKATRNALMEQSDAELEMVIAKLAAQATEERIGYEAEVDKQLEIFKGNLKAAEKKAIEEEQVAMGRYAVDHEKVEILEEEVSLLESRITGMERRVAQSEENLKEETFRTLEVKKEVQLRINSLKEGQNRGLELAKREVSSF